MHKQKSGEKILLIRRVRTDDCEDIWRWRNDPLVRQSSFSPGEILLADHKVWFEEKMNDENTLIYILEDQQGMKLGQVRFQIQENTASISMNLNPEYIGKGLGAYVIMEATQTLIKERHNVVSIQAEVLVDNIASQKVFQKAGYSLQGQHLKQGKEYFVYANRP